MYSSNIVQQASNFTQIRHILYSKNSLTAFNFKNENEEMGEKKSWKEVSGEKSVFANELRERESRSVE